MHATTSHQIAGTGSSDDLTGLDILLVEDSRDVGEAVKTLLELCGARVDGPAANTAEAEGLLAARRPDVALVDFHLRGGEHSYGLITRLRAEGVPVIVLSGSFEISPLPSLQDTPVLEKPVGEAELLAHLSPFSAKKAAR
jgi:DNA-binding response OmpR family regulator